MCMLKQEIRGRGEDFAIDLYCDNTYKPITVIGELGMYCAERCDEAEDITRKQDRKDLISRIIDSVEW